MGLSNRGSLDIMANDGPCEQDSIVGKWDVQGEKGRKQVHLPWHKL